MNLVVDESVDRQVVDRLREEGHEVIYVAELAPGIDDDAVLEQANDRRALLVTADKDFGDLVFRQRLVHRGVLLLRLDGLSARDKAQLAAAIFARHGPEMAEAFSVLTPGGLRIRRPD